MLPVQPAPNRVLSPRVLSIDVLRGLTIALMILVNDPGDWGHVYPQLDHAAWNGFTLTDFVFPNFLFLVGASIVFSIQSRIAKGETKRTLALRMFRRALTLFAIKLFLSAFPHFHVSHLRLYGVLTRIALCYLAAGLICLGLWNTRHRTRILLGLAAALLLGYWALMRFVPVPGLAFASHRDAVPTHAIPILDPDRNLAAWLDRAVNASTQRFLHTGSLYNHTRDPEGLLSTLPAIATTLIGCLTGLWLRRTNCEEASSRPAAASVYPKEASSRPVASSVYSKEASSRPEWGGVEGPPHLPRIATEITPGRCLTGLTLTGLISLIAGLLWNPWFPINKNLWTSSYVLFSAGLSLLLLALCYWLIDIRRFNDKAAGKAALWPWLVFGSNAITAYVVSDLIVETMIWIKVPAGTLVDPSSPARSISAWQWTYLHLFARHGSTEITSVAFALAFTALCFLPNWFLWRRKIFLRI
jgi:predicted acyltransferase